MGGLCVFSLIFLVIAVLYFLNLVKWSREPDFGWSIVDQIGGQVITEVYGEAESAGLRVGDRIVGLNHKVVSGLQEMRQYTNRESSGENVYEVKRGGQTVNVTVPNKVRGFQRAFFQYGLTWLLGLVFFVLGAVVFFMKPGALASWAFLITMFISSVDICFSFTSKLTPDWLGTLKIFSAAFSPAAILHVAQIFPVEQPWIANRPFLLGIPYLVSLALFVVMRFLAPLFTDVPIFWKQVTNAYYIASFVYFIGSVLHVYVKSASVIARVRAKIIFIGTCLSTGLPATNAMMLLFFQRAVVPHPLYNLPFYIVLPLVTGYAIVKHNLFDVDVYIKRAVGYGMMTVIVGMGYFSIQTVTNKLVFKPLFGDYADEVFPIAFALLVVFFFNPINRRVQEGVDKLFFRKQYDFKAAVGSISDVLSALTDLQEIIKQVIQKVRKELFLDSAGVILLDDRKKDCQALFLADGLDKGTEQEKNLLVTYDDPLLALLAQERTVITRYDIAEDPKYASVREPCGQRFLDMGASLALPLFHGDDFTGVLALGYKKSGHFYTREDIDLLKTVSSMMSTAIEQAREKGQRQVLMQLFSKHVSPEVAETIWQQRDMFLEGGRPRSQLLTATVLFTDLAGFSSVSEKTDPQALMDWLNTYMNTIAKVIMDHGGVIDDYFGDGMKADFGVPVPRTTEAEIRDDATNAVKCALAMSREMVQLNRVMTERGLPGLKMRVGIYTGTVVAGSLGSSERLKYTTIGDVVNIASRLESFDKDLVLPDLEASSCRILIGESTLRYLDDQFQTRHVGELSLKGKEEKIMAYWVLGRKATS